MKTSSWPLFIEVKNTKAASEGVAETDADEKFEVVTVLDGTRKNFTYVEFKKRLGYDIP